MVGLTTNSSSETREVADPSTVGVVEALEDNISTLNTSMSPLGIFPFKKQRLRQSKQYSKTQAKWGGRGGFEPQSLRKPDAASTSVHKATAPGCRMFRPITGSAHGPNHPTTRPVNREVFSLTWAEPSVRLKERTVSLSLCSALTRRSQIVNNAFVLSWLLRIVACILAYTTRTLRLTPINGDNSPCWQGTQSGAGVWHRSDPTQLGRVIPAWL
ncbi:hypothetical protein LSAT2_010258 [Lamellibrachia satsuma]|nr:hypothetical protein LSAT2_010258 [Lamellibrachia satsuma]